MNQTQSYRDRVAGAFRAAWLLKLLAWSTAAVGVVSLVGTAILFVAGHLTPEAAFGAILGTALGTILTGGTAYASATNLGIAGARLEIAIAATESDDAAEPVDLLL